MLLIGLFYIIIPLILIGVIGIKRQPNVLIWIFTIISFGSVIAYMWATARWELVSIYFRYLFPILFLAACVVSFKRINKSNANEKKLVKIFGIILHSVLIIFISGLNWFTFKGYQRPNNLIDLSSPFKNGRQIVLHGGASPFTNGHYHVKPQNHALDIVGLNSLGMRASSIAGGAELNDYVIYGESVYSPCTGVVAVVVDELDDQIPPYRDIENLAGNHILIETNGVEILLAHFKKGSIKVNVGDNVNPNTLLGQVGNTGNSSEPHLHIHVEKGGDPKTILNGAAVAFSINQKYLVRGEVIEYKK